MSVKQRANHRERAKTGLHISNEISKTELARLFGISRQSIYKAIKTQKLFYCLKEDGKIDLIKACYEWQIYLMRKR